MKIYLCMAVFWVWICVDGVSATEQIPDRVEFNGDTYIVMQEYLVQRESDSFWIKEKYFPLDLYCSQHGKTLFALSLPARCCSTSCLRGYSANWQIRDSYFYLISLKNFDFPPERRKISPPSAVNPGWKSPTFADWFTDSFLLIESGIDWERYDFNPIAYRVKCDSGNVRVIPFRKVPIETNIQDISPFFTETLQADSVLFFRSDFSRLSSLRRTWGYMEPGMSVAEVKKWLAGYPWGLPLSEKRTSSGFILNFGLLRKKKDSSSPGDISAAFIFSQTNSSTDTLEKLRLWRD